MKRIGILLLVLLAVAAKLVAQSEVETPEKYTLKALEVVGDHHHDSNRIINQSGLEIGEEILIPGPQITTAMKRLWEGNRYEDITILTDSIEQDTSGNQQLSLLILLEELPTLGFHAYEGISKGQAEELNEKLTLFPGTPWTGEQDRRTRRVIRNYFVEKGYYHTKVDIGTQSDALQPDRINLQINVDKGQRIKINEIKFMGNQQFRDAKLKSQLTGIKERKWWRVWKRSEYHPADFPLAKRNLIDFYNKEGFRDAQITFDTIYDHDENSIDIEMKIREGQPYYFRDIQWVGNYQYTNKMLDTLFSIQKGDRYNAELLERRLRGDLTGTDISALYLDDGYLFFNVEPVEKRVEGDSIDLEMRITEGPQATIRKIIVEGNTKTSDYVILRELRYLPGQKFSRMNLMRSQRDILALGFFNQENLEVTPLPDPTTGTVDIKYKVEEQPTDKFQMQLGWSPQLTDNNGNQYGGGFVGGVNMTFDNFSTKRLFKKREWAPLPSGDGQKISLAAQFSPGGRQNYSLSFLEPWLGGKKPNSLGASVFYTVNQNPDIDFKMKTLGASLDFGHRMKWPDDQFQSYTSLSYKYYDIQNGGGIFGNEDNSGIDDGFINVLTVRQSFQRSSIDAPVFPRSGSVFNFSVEATPPWSLLGRYKGRDLTEVPNPEKFNLLEYHKWKFSAEWYHEIVKDLVIRPKIEAGFLGSYNADYGVSPFERFQMGGSGLGGANFYGLDFVSLRGYPNNSLTPSDQGGTLYNKYSLELRYPITLTQSVPIWVLAFGEAGNTWDGFKQFDPLDLKRSAGVGFRAVLPMIGLFGVDVGWGFDPLPSGERLNKPQLNFVIGREF